ncbi:uncharacterized protein C8Q71DRAFT_727379 [Rhodofomes roseus]|uniref:DUF6532 domain-containing protein n=1 Tax=Rhodofomes roseus TaxID=34475 RepID=A0ABQ8K2U7_9APHY|nr:uncharacterized protein C8Q71DRAFT_727379 [Rhodofomes roseus]KAH9830636.1 hypothetical protein C8Q71DRAFT_727379 [Rhodofomes roseus]
MANRPRRKKGVTPKRLPADPSQDSESTQSNVRGKDTAPVMAMAMDAPPTGSQGDTYSEEVDNGLGDLQKEMKSLRRAEHDAIERAREKEIANPTITKPRAAKTQAYEARVWKPKKPDSQKRDREESPEHVPAPKPVKRTRTVGRKGKQPAAIVSDDEEAQELQTTEQVPRHQHAQDVDNSGRTYLYLHLRGQRPHQHNNQADIDEDEDVNESDSEVEMNLVATKLDQHQHRVSLAATGRGGDISDRSDNDESNAEDFESGAEPEDEEDFGVPSGPAPSTKRKVAKVAQQLKQGVAKLVSKGKSRNSNEDDYHSGDSDTGSDADYTADFLEPGYNASNADSHGRHGGHNSKQAAIQDDEFDEEEWKCEALQPEAHASAHLQEVVVRRARRNKADALCHYVRPMDNYLAPPEAQHDGDKSNSGTTGRVGKLKIPSSSQRPSGDSLNTSNVIAQSNVHSHEPEAAERVNRVPHAKRVDSSVSKRSKAASSGDDPAAKPLSEPHRGRNIARAKRPHGTDAPRKETTPTAARHPRHGDKANTQAVQNKVSATSDDPLSNDSEPMADAREVLPSANTWPEDTDVTYDDRNRVVGLTLQQSLKVRTLLKSTIAHELPRALGLVNAFPTVVERPQMYLDIFLAGTCRLGPDYNTIGQRLLQDSAYVQGLTALNDTYTEFKRDLPFCAEPIINLASILFLGPKAVRPLEDSAFTSSINTGAEAEKREIPQVMAALLATIAGAAITEGLHGVREPLKDNEGFNATQQEKLYQDHLTTLSTLNPIGRHKILGYIFKEAKFVGLPEH